jgi:hypothetical protein
MPAAWRTWLVDYALRERSAGRPLLFIALLRPWYGRAMQDHIMQFFAYSHLPAHLQEASKPFGDLATHIIDTLPRNPERTVALRKLLEAKDAAVRARLAVAPPAQGPAPDAAR